MPFVERLETRLRQCRDIEDVFDAFLEVQSQGADLLLAAEGLAGAIAELVLRREELFFSQYAYGAAPPGELRVTLTTARASGPQACRRSGEMTPLLSAAMTMLVVRMLALDLYFRSLARWRARVPPVKERRRMLGAWQPRLLAQPADLLEFTHAVHPAFWYELGLAWEALRAHEAAISCYLRQREQADPSPAKLFSCVRLVRWYLRQKRFAAAIHLADQAGKEQYRDFILFHSLELLKARAYEAMGMFQQAHQQAMRASRRAWAAYHPRLLKRSLLFLLGFYLRHRPWKLIWLPGQTLWTAVASPQFRERLAQAWRMTKCWRLSRTLPVRKAPARKDIHRIAVVRLDRLGDLVCSLPAMRLLRQHYPQAEIWAYVSSGLEFIAEQARCCDRVVGVRLDEKKAFRQAKARFNEQDFDLVIDLLDVERSWEIKFLWGCKTPNKLGFDTRLRRYQFNYRVPLPMARMHLADHVVRLLRPLGIRPDSDGPALPELKLSAEIQSLADGLLPPGQPGSPLVGIHCGSGYRFRYWPEERFAAVADRLTWQRQARIVLLAGEDERGMVEQIRWKMRSEAVTPHTQSLAQLAAVLGRLDLLICMDTGPMHLAGALGTPLVAVWGPGSLDIFRPRWPKCRVVCHLAECNGCPQEGSPRRCSLGYTREQTPCMSDITVEEVVDACLAVLEGPGLNG